MAHCVLVAGEHWKLTTGEHNMGTNHCSMEHVGAAFDALRALGVPRSRIIVIAQIEERREWLRRAVASGQPSCVSGTGDAAGEEAAAAAREGSRKIYRRKLAALEQWCGGIIREGGADYDGDTVNPETIYSVLTAALNDDAPPAAATAQPVVPRDARGIALMIYSHGCSHETAALDGDYWRQLVANTPCDVCGKPHPLPAPDEHGAAGPAEAAAAAEAQPDHEHVSLRTNEWYIHLPHNSPSAATKAAEAADAVAGTLVGAAGQGAADAETKAERAAEAAAAPAVPAAAAVLTRQENEMVAMYEGIAHSQHPHPYSLLYWQILFKIYHRRFSAAPGVPMLVLLNSCRSGGMSKFLEQELVDRTYGVHDWPLYVMSSSQAERDAVRTHPTRYQYHIVHRPHSARLLLASRALHRQVRTGVGVAASASVAAATQYNGRLFSAVCCRRWLAGCGLPGLKGWRVLVRRRRRQPE
jgi:hypothetical protein